MTTTNHPRNYDTGIRLLEVEIWDGDALAVSTTMPADTAVAYRKLRHAKDGYAVKVYDVTGPVRYLVTERRPDGTWVGSVG